MRQIIDEATPAVDERDLLGEDFAFALADLITQASGEPFEAIAAIAAADLWRPGENTKRPGYVPRLNERYNDPANRPSLNLIGGLSKDGSTRPSRRRSMSLRRCMALCEGPAYPFNSRRRVEGPTPSLRAVTALPSPAAIFSRA